MHSRLRHIARRFVWPGRVAGQRTLSDLGAVVDAYTAPPSAPQAASNRVKFSSEQWEVWRCRADGLVAPTDAQAPSPTLVAEFHACPAPPLPTDYSVVDDEATKTNRLSR